MLLFYLLCWIERFLIRSLEVDVLLVVGGIKFPGSFDLFLQKVEQSFGCSSFWLLDFLLPIFLFSGPFVFFEIDAQDIERPKSFST